MRKKILVSSAVLLSFVSSVVFAQSFSLDNITYTSSGSIDDDLLDATIEIVNVSGSTKNVHVKRQNISVVSGSDNNFCWGTNCYPPNVNVSTTPEAINAGSLNTTFKGDYYSNGNVGLSRIRYTFFDANNPNDSIDVTIAYEAYILGSKKLAKTELKNSMSNIYPNPAASFATLEYSVAKTAKTSKIVISNMIGSTVKEITLNDNKGVIVLPVSQLENGFYFYSLEVDGNTVATKRLVVSH